MASPWYKGWCWAMAASGVGIGLLGLLAGLSPVFPLVCLTEGLVFVSIRTTGRPRLYHGVRALQAAVFVALIVAAVVSLIRFGTLDPGS